MVKLRELIEVQAIEISAKTTGKMVVPLTYSSMNTVLDETLKI